MRSVPRWQEERAPHAVLLYSEVDGVAAVPEKLPLERARVPLRTGDVTVGDLVKVKSEMLRRRDVTFPVARVPDLREHAHGDSSEIIPKRI